MITTRTPVKWEGSYPDIAIKQGFNQIEEKFWIQVTDRRKGITIRGYMPEEYYQNFHNMGNYIFKQHGEQDSDTEFEIKEDPRTQEIKCDVCNKESIYISKICSTCIKRRNEALDEV